MCAWGIASNYRRLRNARPAKSPNALASQPPFWRDVSFFSSSAARGLLGKTVSLARTRGSPIPLEDGSELWVTAHPSYLLRLDGPARGEQERLFAADLAAVRGRLAELK